MSRKEALIGAIEELGNAIEGGNKEEMDAHFHNCYIKAQNLGLKETEPAFA